MDMSNLRSRVIRLAYARPELRPSLLPILGIRVAESFEEAVKGRTFKNPDTGNDVQFGSLPSEEQAKLRAKWKEKNEDEGGGDAISKEIKQTEKALKDATKELEDWHDSDDGYNFGFRSDEEIHNNISWARDKIQMRKTQYFRNADKAKKYWSENYPKLDRLMYAWASPTSTYREDYSDLDTVEGLKKFVGGVKKELDTLKDNDRNILSDDPDFVSDMTRLIDSRLEESIERSKSREKIQEKVNKLTKKKKDLEKQKEESEKKPKEEPKEESPADLKEKALDRAKNMKDPEERAKAIKRVKEMKPEDLKGFLAGTGSEKEGEGGKKASLRSSVIRLAHAKPELRPALLPLLKR